MQNSRMLFIAFTQLSLSHTNYKIQTACISYYCSNVAIGNRKSIEWLRLTPPQAQEDRHSVKLSWLLALDCAGIERLSVPQRNSCVSLGEPICIVC